MSSTTSTPSASEHIVALIQGIPEHMRKQTVTLNRRLGVLYLRPTVLADFLRQSSEKNRQATTGLYLEVTSGYIQVRVTGYALSTLSTMNLPCYTERADKYEFIHGAMPMLEACISHKVFRNILEGVYQGKIAYSPAMITKLGEHLKIHPSSRVEPTKIRIKIARQTGQKQRL